MDNNHRLFISGLGKTGAWFVASRLTQITAAVWVTRILLPEDFAILAVIFAIQGFIQQFTAINLSSELVRAHTKLFEMFSSGYYYTHAPRWQRNGLVDLMHPRACACSPSGCYSLVSETHAWSNYAGTANLVDWVGSNPSH
jgi:hypothetical protein